MRAPTITTIRVEEFFYQIKGNMVLQGRRERSFYGRTDPRGRCIPCCPRMCAIPAAAAAGLGRARVEAGAANDVDGFEWFCLFLRGARSPRGSDGTTLVKDLPPLLRLLR